MPACLVLDLGGPAGVEPLVKVDAIGRVDPRLVIAELNDGAPATGCFAVSVQRLTLFLFFVSSLCQLGLGTTAAGDNAVPGGLVCVAVVNALEAVVVDEDLAEGPDVDDAELDVGDAAVHHKVVDLADRGEPAVRRNVGLLGLARRVLERARVRLGHAEPPNDVEQVVDKLGIDFRVREPGATAHFDRGFHGGEHVDLAGRVLDGLDLLDVPLGLERLDAAADDVVVEVGARVQGLGPDTLAARVFNI